MFGKNKNKKVGLCVMVVTSCFILAGLWAVLATPETALAHKDPADPDHSHGGGGGGGGGGDKVPTCVQFDDGDDDIRSDDGTPYCHSKKEKITVKFLKLTNDSLYLQTNSTDKAANGRGIFIDFGTEVTLAPDDPVNEMVITSTKDALDDPRVLGVSATLNVGAHQDEFNFFNFVEEGPNYNVNLRILVWFYFREGSGDKRESLLIRLAPNGSGSRICPSSDSVTVTSIDDGSESGVRKWRVETQPVKQGACLSDGNGNLLTDVVGSDPVTGDPLAPGHIALSFGFTVTTAVP